MSKTQETAASLLRDLRVTSLYDLGAHEVVAVITGGGTGLGLHIGKTLAVNGARVYLVGLKEEDVEPVAKVFNDGLQSIKGGLAKDAKVGELIPIVGDASQKSEAQRLGKEIGEKEKKGVTVLFNNAGVGGSPLEFPSKPSADSLSSTLLSATPDDFHSVLSTNLLGPYYFSAAFLPLLSLYSSSHPSSPVPAQVINTCSINSFTKDTATGMHSMPYILSKSALKQLTSLLARLFLPLGVRVNAIAPGWFITGMTAKGGVDELGRGVMDDSDSTKMLKDMQFEVPLGPRGGRPEDIGGLAMMLVTNRFINGETVLIDGGSLLVHPSSH